MELNRQFLTIVVLLAALCVACPRVAFRASDRQDEEIDLGDELDVAQDFEEDSTGDEALTPDDSGSTTEPDQPNDHEPIEDQATDHSVEDPIQPVDASLDLVEDTSIDSAADIPAETEVVEDPLVDTAEDPPIDTAADPELEPVEDIPQDLPYGGTMILTEVCDHSERSGARFVEVFNATGESVFLGDYTIELWGRHNPGTGDPTAVYQFPDVYLDNGRCFVVAKDRVSFTLFYPQGADDYSLAINGDGQDTYALRHHTTLIDIYGEIGVDGFMEPWRYNRAVANRRIQVIDGSTYWRENEWDVVSGSGTASPGDR